MAKALLGHMGSDHLLRAELVSLRARVRAQESEIAALRAEAALAATIVESVIDVKDADLHSELAELDRATPALA